MPIKNQKVKDLYQVLQQGGADVGTEDEFNDWLFKAGDEGYQNRKELWNTLKEGGADAGETYEDFRDWLGLHPVQNDTGTQQGATSAGQTGESTTGVTPPAKMADAARNTTLTDQSPVDAVRQDSTGQQSGIAGVTREQAAGNPPPSPKDISDAQDFAVYNAYSEGYKNAQEGGKTAFSKAREMAQTQGTDEGIVVTPHGVERADADTYNQQVLSRAREAEKHYLNEKAGDLARSMVQQMSEHSFDRMEDLRNIYYSDEVRNAIEDMRAKSGIYDYNVLMDNFVKPQLKRIVQDRFRLTDAETDRIVGGIASKREDTERIADEREEYATMQKYIAPSVDKYLENFDTEVDQMLGAKREASDNAAAAFIPSSGKVAKGISDRLENMKEKDAEKVWQGLSQKVEDVVSDLIGNEDFMAYMQQQANKVGAKSGADYFYDAIYPTIANRIEQKFTESEIARNMPKSGLEYVLSKFHDSVTGMLLDIGTKSQRQRDIESQARQLTAMGQNPDVKPKWWHEIASVVPEMAPDFWMWGMAGKLGGKASAKLMQEQIANYAAREGVTMAVAARQLAEMAAQHLPTRIKQNLINHMIQMGVMMPTAEGVTEVVRGVHDGENADQIMSNVFETGLTGGRHGAELGGVIGLMSALTGRLKGVWKAIGKAGAYTAEAGTMYGQEVASRLMAGEGLPDNPGTGFGQAMLRLGMIKLSGNMSHTAERVGNFFRAPKTNLMDWYRNPSARGVLTERDLRYLGDKDGSEFVSAINAYRPETYAADVDKAAQDEGYIPSHMSTPEMRKAERAYKKFMNRKDVPLHNRAHLRRGRSSCGREGIQLRNRRRGVCRQGSACA